MPVVLRVQGYKFWFYMADVIEPPIFTLAKMETKRSFGSTP